MIRFVYSNILDVSVALSMVNCDVTISAQMSFSLLQTRFLMW